MAAANIRNRPENLVLLKILQFIIVKHIFLQNFELGPLVL